MPGGGGGGDGGGAGAVPRPTLPIREWHLDAVLIAVIIGHVIIAPFTKVEESFNVQGMNACVCVCDCAVSVSVRVLT